jgi:hypothetical protein
MNPLFFMSVGDSSMLLFRLQMVVLIIGVLWCVALASILFFGGWYAHTHPTTGNDRVMRRLARFLRVLTLGLTDAPFPDQEDENAHLLAEKEQDDAPARFPHQQRSVLR